MSLLSLDVTIDNHTSDTLTLTSGPGFPASIAAGSTAEESWKSSWTEISNNVTYQIDSTHSVNMYWTVRWSGPNIYHCSVSPNDGRYQVKRSGSGTHDYNCVETFTISQGS